MQDLASDLMALLPDGDKALEVLRRYEGILVREDGGDHEPGDIMALIAPLLVLHGVQEQDISGAAAAAHLIADARSSIGNFELSGWKVFCISSVYEQYGLHIANKLGIFSQNSAFTVFPLSDLRRSLRKEDTTTLQMLESSILELYPPADEGKIKSVLDRAYGELAASTGGKAFGEIKPVSGKRKLGVLTRFASKSNQPLSGWVAVGDGINDAALLQAVNKAGGLSIAFNADLNALSSATLSVASGSLKPLLPVLEAWKKGQHKVVERYARERAGSKDPLLHWLPQEKDLDSIAGLHRHVRVNTGY